MINKKYIKIITLYLVEMIYYKYLYPIYFTNFPSFLYSISNQSGNMAYAGVALGLIRSQQLFWLANGLICLSFFMYYKMVLYNAAIMLYILSFSKSYKLLPLLNSIIKPKQQ